ncbi:tail spike protein [Bacillus phage Mater]|uniref:Tail spike protein n=1 Tax=Bacillus phage Mater TaxID=1540090 RepID=A0A0A0RMM0_9CAUD|nr:tail spike protein [Bacillus phage Mater]AIW03310.1 tail spike protein [Bacillus phage Mater]
MANEVKKVKLLLRRGQKQELTNLDEAEVAVTTDTYEMYYGSRAGNVRIAKYADVSDLDKKTDAFISTSAMNVKGGDKTKDDAVGIIATIAMAQTLGRKRVVIPDGQYYIGQTIVVPERIYFDMGKDTELIPTNDVNILQMKPQAHIDGGIINTKRFEGRTFNDFTKACIYLDGNDIFSLVDQLHRISNVVMMGEDHYYTDQKWTGTGIHFYSGKGSGGVPSFISFVQTNNVGIFNFYRGIFLDVDDTITSNDEWAWVTGCNFDGVAMMNCQRSIDMKGAGSVPRDVGGNTFTNLQIQVEKNTERALFCQGSYNRFKGTFWDLHKCPHEVVEFDEGAKFNEVECAHGYEQPQHFRDKGYMNTISSVTNHVPDKLTLAYPLSTPFRPSFIGNQDDYLVRGDARGYTITQTSTHPIKNGMPLTELLTMDTEVGVVWDGTNATYENPIVIEVDTSSDPIYYAQFIGYVTAWKDFPRGCEIEVYDETTAQWYWAHGLDNNSSYPFVVSAPWAGADKATKIRYKFWGTNNDTTKAIEVGRLIAMSSKQEGKAWMPRAGGKLYGDIMFKFFDGVVFEDQNGKQHKFVVENNTGLLVNRNIRLRNHVPAMRNAFNRVPMPFKPYFNGNQDDYLADGVSRGYTVTSSATPLAGALTDILSMDMETGPVFDATNATAQTPITVTINTASDEIPYCAFVGIFSPDNNSPQNVIIEVYDRSSASWVEFHNETGITENFSVSADWNSAMFARQIRIKMWGTNGKNADGSSTNKISLSRVVAQSTKAPGNAFMPKSGGSFTGKVKAAKGFVLPSVTADPADAEVGQMWFRSDL